MKYYVAISKEITGFAPFMTYLKSECRLSVLSGFEKRVKTPDGDRVVYLFKCDSSPFRFLQFCIANRRMPVMNKGHQIIVTIG